MKTGLLIALWLTIGAPRAIGSDDSVWRQLTSGTGGTTYQYFSTGLLRSESDYEELKDHIRSRATKQYWERSPLMKLEVDFEREVVVLLRDSGSSSTAPQFQAAGLEGTTLRLRLRYEVGLGGVTADHVDRCWVLAVDRSRVETILLEREFRFVGTDQELGDAPRHRVETSRFDVGGPSGLPTDMLRPGFPLGRVIGSAPPPVWSEGVALVDVPMSAVTVVKRVEASYPPDLDPKPEGVVILEAIVSTEGLVREAKVLRSVPGLDDAALDAVKQWRFRPHAQDGVNVEMRVVVTVRFPPED